VKSHQGVEKKSVFHIYWFLLCLFCALSVSAETTSKDADKVLTLDETLKSLGSLQEGGVEFRWDPFFQSGVFSTVEHYASFRAGTAGEAGVALIDGTEILEPPSPFIEKGQLHFPEAFVASIKRGLEQAMQKNASLFRIAAIIVDAGHGGKDTGALGNHTINGKSLMIVEKDITLKVSRDLYAQLSEGFPDKRVLLTRNSDVFLTLDERVAIANAVPLKENEAIVFVSIHANASFNKTVRGYEVWYLNPNYRRTIIDSAKYAGAKEVIPIYNDMLQEEFTTESVMIAKAILKRFEETMGKSLPSRGLKAEEWFVVRNTQMPAVLVELGFLTNETDALLLADDEGLKKFSGALYKGIRDFVVDFERSGGFTGTE
jgi:N-acetylmuramoyl-L-alanine amidase